jgi:hypothetical protein
MSCFWLRHVFWLLFSKIGLQNAAFLFDFTVRAALMWWGDLSVHVRLCTDINWICTQKCSWRPFPKRYNLFGKIRPTFHLCPPWRFNSISVVICTPFSLKQDVHVSFTFYLKSFFDLTKKGEEGQEINSLLHYSLTSYCNPNLPPNSNCSVHPPCPCWSVLPPLRIH